jgi:hypothetical protein
MEGELMSLPERINVTYVVTYTVPDIVAQIVADRDSEVIYDKRGAHPIDAGEDITLDDVLARIEDWVADDFGDISQKHLIFTDEYGNEL